MVQSLALYEPVVRDGRCVGRRAPADAALREIEAVAASARERVARGELADAAALFVDYWGGADSWRSLDAAQQAVVMSRIVAVPNHFEATFAATWGRETLSRLTMPTLLMHGGADPRVVTPRGRTACCVAAADGARARSRAQRHLGPITHDALVNREIVAHVEPARADREHVRRGALSWR